MPFTAKPDDERGRQHQIRFSPSLMRRIVAAAEEDGCGWSTWVRGVVERELARREKKAWRLRGVVK